MAGLALWPYLEIHFPLSPLKSELKEAYSQFTSQLLDAMLAAFNGQDANQMYKI
jgi:hypothetical protein